MQRHSFLPASALSSEPVTQRVAVGLPPISRTGLSRGVILAYLAGFFSALAALWLAPHPLPSPLPLPPSTEPEREAVGPAVLPPVPASAAELTAPPVPAATPPPQAFREPRLPSTDAPPSPSAPPASIPSPRPAPARLGPAQLATSQDGD